MNINSIYGLFVSICETFKITVGQSIDKSTLKCKKALKESNVPVYVKTCQPDQIRSTPIARSLNSLINKGAVI